MRERIKTLPNDYPDVVKKTIKELQACNVCLNGARKHLKEAIILLETILPPKV